ncbi:MAG: RtcB family protein [Myxococcota bacterium]|nr:RtcB family protein [Myxococcota bacterium]
MLADAVLGLDDFMGPNEGLSRDSQIGSIGGGNHFVEVQSVQSIFDARTAHQWGLRRGMVTVMVHTGSVAIGHVCGNHYREQVRGLFPKTLTYPANALFPLPTGQAHQAQVESFWNALHNAANFAFANRHFLALMAVEGLCRVLGEFEQTLLYDAPHNLVWREHDEQGEVFVHRKGACPARGFEAMAESPFAFTGERVLVPGSMGASSFVMAGQGNADALCSASHGAGRRLSRGQASRGDEAAFRSFLERFRIVTPVDLRRQDVKLRRDIVARKLAELRQEAPQAYKDLGPIVTTLRDAGVARPVAELRPLMTLKA